MREHTHFLTGRIDDIKFGVTAVIDHRVRLVIKAIQRDLSAPIDIERLAGIAGMSPAGLRATFRKSVGVSPHRFVKKLRLDRARVLLSSETASVKEIMASVGYSDPSHFVRDFERAYGLSPGGIHDGDNIVWGSI